MIKKFLIILIAFGVILIIPSSINATEMEQKKCSYALEYLYTAEYYNIWHCLFCKKEVKLPSYFNPRYSNDPYYHKLRYGCSKNKVEGTHDWIIIRSVYY